VTAWKDNIKVGFKDIGWEGANWIHLAQDRDKRRGGDLVNTVMNIKCGEFLD
jgi:hypothetical protein